VARTKLGIWFLWWNFLFYFLLFFF